jgi:hypothetical protein
VKRAGLLLLVLSAADWALTVDGLLLGFCRELNPVIAAAFAAGTAGSLALKLAITAAGAALLAALHAERALWLCVYVYAGVIAYHVAARVVLF